MHYEYNGRGEQVHRFVNGRSIFFMYDEAGHWLGQYDHAGRPTRQVIWLDDLPVGVVADDKLLYIAADALGTPRVVWDPQRGKELWRLTWGNDAFGSEAPLEDRDGDGVPFVFDMRFPGQRYDAASGLNYNYYRDGYESGTGRYTQSDPIGLRGGISTYLYAMGSPLLRIDPMGLQAIPMPAPPLFPIVPPHNSQPGGEADPNDYSGTNVIPFPRTKTNDTCPPDNDCTKRKAALMALHFGIDAQSALEHVRGVYDYELTARKLLWNRAANDWNSTCGPLGYPIIEAFWFYDLGPRKL